MTCQAALSNCVKHPQGQTLHATDGIGLVARGKR
jgi:hypothetical protein